MKLRNNLTQSDTECSKKQIMNLLLFYFLCSFQKEQLLRRYQEHYYYIQYLFYCYNILEAIKSVYNYTVYNSTRFYYI